MAKFHYDLTGAEPIIRDVPIYAVAKIVKGEMLQAGPIAATLKAGFVTTNALTAAAGIDSLGACMEDIGTTTPADFGDIVSTAATTSTRAISSIASTVATGSRYGKAIINPTAIYLFEWDQTSTGYCTSAAVSASATYTQVVEQYGEGGWLYSVPGVSGAVAANEGQLRYITVSTTTGSYTLLSTVTLAATEKLISIKPVNHRILGVSGVASTATVNYPTKLSNLTSMAASSTIMYHIVENYVGGKNKPLEPLRASVHNGIQDKTLKFYSDVAQLDHVYCHATAGNVA